MTTTRNTFKPQIVYFLGLFICFSKCLLASFPCFGQSTSPRLKPCQEAATSFKSSPPIAEWISIRQPPASAQDRHRAVVLLHGLNLNPPKMDELGSWLLSLGVTVVRPALSEHRSSSTKGLAPEPVNRDAWLLEAWQAVCLAHALINSAAPNSDLYNVDIIGYSMGGAVAWDLLGQLQDPSSRQSKTIGKMVLLAPAVEPFLGIYAFRLLKWWPKLEIPSVAPTTMRANSTTSIAAYNALMDHVAAVRSLPAATIQNPTLIAIDRNDELVSSSRLEHGPALNSLAKQEFLLLDRHATASQEKKPSPSTAGNFPYHALFTAEAVSAADWEKLLGRIRGFLGY